MWDALVIFFEACFVGVMLMCITYTMIFRHHNRPIMPFHECACIEQRYRKNERHKSEMYYTTRSTRWMNEREFYSRCMDNLESFVRCLREDVRADGYVARSDTSSDTVAQLTVWRTAFHRMAEWVSGRDYSESIVTAGFFFNDKVIFTLIKSRDGVARAAVDSKNRG